MGTREQERTERSKDSNDKNLKDSSEKLLRESQQEVPQQQKKVTRPNDVPDLQIVDGTRKEAQKDGVTEVWNNAGGRRVEIRNGDKVQSVEYDSSGKAIRYTAADGEVFQRTERTETDTNGKNVDVWDSNNPVSKGANIEIDPKTNAITITDRGTGHVVTRTTDGVESVKYKDAGSTSTTFTGNKEVITITDKNRPGTRTMVLENDEKGAKLKSYTDHDGRVYEDTGERVPPDREAKEYKQRPIFKMEDGNGNVGLYTISADRTGNVVVRKYDKDPAQQKELEKQPDFARRELNNGNVITSDGDNNVRRTVTADGTTIDDRKNGAQSLKTITYSNGNKMDLTYNANGQLMKVDGIMDGKEVSYQRKDPTWVDTPWASKDNSETYMGMTIEEKNGQVVFKPKNEFATVIDQKGFVSQTNATIESPKDPADSTVIAKKPKNVDLEKNIKDAERHPVSYSQQFWSPVIFVENGYWFRAQTDYGKTWDFKTPGGEYITNVEYEDYGNWHLGVVAAAAQFDKSTTLEEAGAAQQRENTSRPNWGSPGIGVPGLRIFGDGSYGDDPEDQEQIKQGYDWYVQQKQKKAAA